MLAYLSSYLLQALKFCGRNAVMPADRPRRRTLPVRDPATHRARMDAESSSHEADAERAIEIGLSTIEREARFTQQMFAVRIGHCGSGLLGG